VDGVFERSGWEYVGVDVGEEIRKAEVAR